MIDNLNSINESVRKQLNNLERIRRESDSIYTDNKYEYLLKDILNDYFLAAIADLMALSGLLFEASYCENKTDIKMLVDITKFEQKFNRS
jgi:hypothetical protein